MFPFICQNFCIREINKYNFVGFVILLLFLGHAPSPSENEPFSLISSPHRQRQSSDLIETGFKTKAGPEGNRELRVGKPRRHPPEG